MSAPANRRLITEARLLDGTGKVKVTLLPEELGLSTEDVADILSDTVFDPEGITITLNEEEDAIFVNSIAIDQPPHIYTGSHTLLLGDADVPVEMDVAVPNTVTIPNNASVAFPLGTVIEICQAGSGTTTVGAVGGVSVRSRGSLFALAGQWATVSIRLRAIDDWVLSGDVA